MSQQPQGLERESKHRLKIVSISIFFIYFFFVRILVHKSVTFHLINSDLGFLLLAEVCTKYLLLFSNTHVFFIPYRNVFSSLWLMILMWVWGHDCINVVGLVPVLVWPFLTNNNNKE
jgi:hypothetical protein